MTVVILFSILLIIVGAAVGADIGITLSTKDEVGRVTGSIYGLVTAVTDQYSQYFDRALKKMSESTISKAVLDDIIEDLRYKGECSPYEYDEDEGGQDYLMANRRDSWNRALAAVQTSVDNAIGQMDWTDDDTEE